MALTKTGYVLSLIIQHLFILIDVICNTASDTILVRKSPTILFIVFLLQDAFLLTSVTCMCFSLFRTNVFKAGFVELLLYRFKGVIIFSIFYIISTLTLQTYILLLRWDDPLKYNWPPLLNALYIIHRVFSVFFYYFYKRSAMRLSDRRYYDEEWVKHTLTHGTN